MGGWRLLQISRRGNEPSSSAGYYIVELVSIRHLIRRGLEVEEILHAVFRYFDDQAWPEIVPESKCASWSDHEVSRDVASETALAALVGGPEIGHVRPTIPPEQARYLWNRFESFLEPERRYFTGMGFGDREYVFLHGVAATDQEKAGILWTVESDCDLA